MSAASLALAAVTIAAALIAATLATATLVWPLEERIAAAVGPVVQRVRADAWDEGRAAALGAANPYREASQ